MKTKHWLYLSLVSLLPIFFSTLMVAAISFEWLFSDTESSTLANIFLTGKFNRTFSTIFFGIGVLGLSVIMTTILMLFRHSKNIDKLEQAERELYEEKLTYMRATRKIVEQMK